MTDPMPVPDEPREQLEDAAFWWVERDYHERRPVDRRAVYGFVRLGERDPDDIGVPVRNAPRDLKTAIRTLGARHNLKRHPDDRVRVNDGGWMEVVQPTRGRGAPYSVDEGFTARYENGSALYKVKAYNGLGPRATHNQPWMRRVGDDHESAGEVCCLEVEWGDPPR